MSWIGDAWRTVGGWLGIPAGSRRAVNAGVSRDHRLDELDQLYQGDVYDRRPLGQPWDKAPPGAPKTPLRLQKPAVQYQLARILVDRPAALLFGEQRFPRVTWEAVGPEDEAADSDDPVGAWLTNLVDEGHLQQVALTWARLGLTSGSAVMTWGFVAGEIEFVAHRARHCRPTFDPQSGGPVRRLTSLDKRFKFQKRVEQVLPTGITVVMELPHWHRETWDTEAHTVYADVPVEGDLEPAWTVERQVKHGLGLCPARWVKAIDDGDPGTVDGRSILDGLSTMLESIDRTLTGADRGIRYNTEPEKIYIGIPKGQDGKPMAIGGGASTALPEGGDAKLLEMTGDGLKVASAHVDSQRGRALEVARVVMPHPEQLLAASKSGAALRILFAPTIELVDELRQNFGAALRAIFRDLVRCAREGRLSQLADVDGGQDGETMTPPPATIPAGKPVLQWGHYFDPTPDDLLAMAQTAAALKTATLLDDGTLIRFLGPYFGVADVDQVLAALEDQAAQAMGREQQQAKMLASVAGDDSTAGGPPAGED